MLFQSVCCGSTLYFFRFEKKYICHYVDKVKGDQQEHPFVWSVSGMNIDIE